MSQKAFISAAEHLAKLDVTTEQALAFIEANIDQPDAIYIAARKNGVTSTMLSEITNISTDSISDYFEAAGRNPAELDYTSKILNFDPGELAPFIGFNENTGVLSNTSLKEAVQPLLKVSTRYEPTFESPYPNIHPNDNVYDTEELGVDHLGEIAVTSDNIESIFYGSLINLFKVLDQTEIDQLRAFSPEGESDDFEALLLTALDDNDNEASENKIWTDEQLAELVKNEAVTIIDKFWENSFLGILDHSFIGLASA